MRRPFSGLRRPRIAIQRVTTGTFKWSYTVSGSGPPVLLVHGLSGSVGWWRRNIPVFAQHHTVYAVELLGFAANRRGRPLPLRESADALAAFMDAQGIARADIIGHSMGGHISLYLAAKHPQRVDHLVLAAPSGLLRRGLLPMSWQLARASRYGALDMYPTIIWDAIRAGPLNLLLAARALLKDNVSALLPEVHAPTLVLAGANDMLVPPPVCEELAHGIAGATYRMLPKAGHNLMWDQAAAFNDAVASFLDRPPTADRRPPTTGDSAVGMRDSGDT